MNVELGDPSALTNLQSVASLLHRSPRLHGLLTPTKCPYGDTCHTDRGYDKEFFDWIGLDAVLSCSVLKMRVRVPQQKPVLVPLRLVHLARQFADVHCMDRDVLGRMANELMNMIDTLHPSVRDFPRDEEHPL